MSIFSDFYNKIVTDIASRVATAQGQQVARVRAFRQGDQPRPLKVKQGQHDDNIILNYTGLILQRSVSQMIGDGIEFSFDGDGETEQEQYVNAVWDANKQEILLHRCCLAASEAGTGYILINDPALGMGTMIGEDGNEYPRLLMVDPAFVTMETLPEDFEVVVKYTIEYKFIDGAGKEAAHRKVIEQQPNSLWKIVDYENVQGQWFMVNVMAWPHPFRPLVHWQNLPTIDSPYGEPDITADLMETQNKINADMSFLSKSLRLGADPMRWFKGSSAPTINGAGPDKAVFLPPDGDAGQLPPTTDWAGDLAYLDGVRQAMYSIARTVDPETLAAAGDMTNFRTRVIYQDNVSKINTKRELMGDAIEEINRDLLIMAGMEPIECHVVWPDFVPVNKTEEATYWQTLQGLGVISKQTLAEKLGIDWKVEQERLDGEQQAQDNMGAMLLRGFNRGGGGLTALDMQQGGNVESTSTRGGNQPGGGRGAN